ncbi:hypothetical protein GE21DRAFT_1306343 [Neurospora crassa]|nr:hypothetical protein GE21DRAFT_1306343 [Neurospora crassa]
MSTNRLSRMLKRHSPLSGPSYLPISSGHAKRASSIDWPRVSPIVVVIAPAARLGPARLGLEGEAEEGPTALTPGTGRFASVHFTLILSAISKLSAGHIGMVLKLKNGHLRRVPTPMKGKGPVPACFVINSRALLFRAPVTKGPSASLLKDSQAPIYYTTLHVGCPSPVWSVKRVDYSDTRYLAM